MLVVHTASAEVDEEKLTAFLAEMDGKDVAELIAEGSKKLASMPSGGAVSAAPAAGAAAPAAGSAASKKAPEPEPEEEEAVRYLKA